MCCALTGVRIYAKHAKQSAREIKLARFYILHTAYTEKPGIDWANVYEGNDRGLALKAQTEGLIQTRGGGVGAPLEIRLTTAGLDAHRAMMYETADEPDLEALRAAAS